MALSPAARAQWRARREARRAKQRADNVMRARAMHALRLEYEKNVGTPAASSSAGAKAARAFVGCSG